MNFKNKKYDKNEDLSINEFINLSDIRGNFLYTKDEYIFCYLLVQPISTQLMATEEKALFTKRLTEQISPLNSQFKILFLSRPTDVKEIIEYYEDIRAITADIKKRDNLKKMMNYFSNLSVFGGILERKTYICLWKKISDSVEAEIMQKAHEFKTAFLLAGIPTDICNEEEIIQMVSLFLEPANTVLNINDVTPNFTLFKEDNSDKTNK